MRQRACLATISIIGLTACVHHGVHQSEPDPVPSAPSPSASSAVVTEPATSAPAPMPPTGAATLPPEPPAAAPSKPASATAVMKPTAAKPPKEKAAPASAPVAPVAVAADVPAPTPAPPPAPSTPKPQLDFKAMEQRLRNTSAIGVFTKLSIKNQVDDLMKAFRTYHSGRTPPTLDDLHQRYDGLLLKVVSLIQNDDPNLASSISASRSAIWERLSNRESFQAI
jgi:hypothetical protein